MITEAITCTCCGSNKLTRNGKIRQGKQKFRCPACGCYGALNPDDGYSEERKAEILRAYHERSSLRGLERTFGVARQTVAARLKKAPNLPPLETTWMPAQPEDVLELDERWSFIRCKTHACRV